jgi:hypothetical protein
MAEHKKKFIDAGQERMRALHKRRTQEKMIRPKRKLKRRKRKSLTCR